MILSCHPYGRGGSGNSRARSVLHVGHRLQRGFSWQKGKTNAKCHHAWTESDQDSLLGVWSAPSYLLPHTCQDVTTELERVQLRQRGRCFVVPGGKQDMVISAWKPVFSAGLIQADRHHKQPLRDREWRKLVATGYPPQCLWYQKFGNNLCCTTEVGYT